MVLMWYVRLVLALVPRVKAMCVSLLLVVMSKLMKLLTESLPGVKNDNIGVNITTCLNFKASTFSLKLKVEVFVLIRNN